MIRPIVKDPILLAQHAQPATENDLSVAQDLLDTLLAHTHECVGMAANMIGYNKCIIAIMDGKTPIVMLNPVYISRKNSYETEEGCLSLNGVRSATRFRDIQIQYQNQRMQTKMKTFHGFSAQIVQHEMDHLEGILI